MRTDLGIKKIASLTPIVGKLANTIRNDEEFKNLLLSVKESKENNVVIACNLFPVLVEKCENEFYSLLAIIFDKTVEEIKEQDFFVTVQMIADVIANEHLKSFFILLGLKKKPKEEQVESFVGSTSYEQTTPQNAFLNL